LILKKSSKIGATRCQILKLKCTKIDFGWGSAPDPTGGAYSAPSEYLNTVKLYLRGLLLSGRKEGEGEEMRETEGKGKGEGETTLHTPYRKFLATPLLCPDTFLQQQISSTLQGVHKITARWSSS